ncbi:MAG: permease-like cell division protein FtsX [Actinomycetota bacterium]|nr:permease-like cell division protein FtsX [Actinomycetota bacterium]
MKIKPLYYTREAIESLRRNFAMSSAAISTAALSLFMVGAFILMFMILRSFATDILSKLEIEVFLKDEAAEAQVQAFQNEITGWQEVKTINYVSKDDALIRLKEKLKDKPNILEALSGNPLPASIRIFTKDANLIEATVAKINAYPALKDVVEEPKTDIKYGAEYIDRLFSVFKVMGWVGFGAAFLLCFASVVLIINTIRLTILARSKEVGIMRLVGASMWFVRWPFLLEGMFQGLAGSAVAIGLLYFVKVWVLRKLTEIIPFLRISISTASFAQLMLGITFGGIMIGAIGSTIALRRFLRV